MAKRFFTTEMFKDTWFMDLQSKYKLFWLFLITDCSHAGIWQVNYKVASFYVGDHLEPVECERILKDRIIKFDNGKYWFIPKFIEFQYGTTLSKTNKALTGVIDTLIGKNLLQYIPKVTVLEGASKLLQRSSEGLKEKEKDMEKEKEKEEETDEEEISIQNLWIRTFGRNPNLPEVEETQKLINTFGYDQVHQTFKKASLHHIKSLQYLLDNVDNNFNLKPYQNNIAHDSNEEIVYT